MECRDVTNSDKKRPFIEEKIRSVAFGSASPKHDERIQLADNQKQSCIPQTYSRTCPTCLWHRTAWINYIPATTAAPPQHRTIQHQQCQDNSTNLSVKKGNTNPEVLLESMSSLLCSTTSPKAAITLMHNFHQSPGEWKKGHMLKK